MDGLEKYAYKKNGELFVMAPGLLNSLTSKDLRKTREANDLQIIVLRHEIDDDTETFLSICRKLVYEGYQVVVEYSDWVLHHILLRDIKYTAIIPHKDIIKPLTVKMSDIYEETAVYLTKFYNNGEIYGIIDKIKNETNRYLELMSAKFNLKQALTEYKFMEQPQYKYI